MIIRKSTGLPVEPSTPPPEISTHGGSRKGSGRRHKALGSEFGGSSTDVVEVGETHLPSFPVTLGLATVEESAKVNGVALLDDAFRRASLAGTSGDSFDKAIYLELLKPLVPRHKYRAPEPMLPAAAKATLEALDRILAQGGADDASYVERER